MPRDTEQVPPAPPERQLCTSLERLPDIRPLYFLPTDPLAEEVLIPAFRVASSVDCMAGFFSSAVLADLAPGLATYLKGAERRFRLLASPFLQPEDLGAIESGTRAEEDVASNALEEVIITQDLLEQHTLRCLSYLLQTERIEIRVALMKNALFHPKVWIFEQDGSVMTVHGSSNPTHAGIRTNFEQISVSASWEDSNQKYATAKFREQFRRLWEDREESCRTIRIPEAVRYRILRHYPVNEPPTVEDFRSLYDKVNSRSEPTVGDTPPQVGLDPIEFRIPSGLRFEDGPFEHQGRAIRAWLDSGCRGILEMATGSGKTITAMICAHRLHEDHKPLMVVVAAPYVPLIQQWCEEISAFGLRPTNLISAAGVHGRARQINRAARRLRSGDSSAEAILVSHRTLCDKSFKNEIENIDATTLLIADEVHNLGSEGFISSPPDSFDYRLGLSATPMRQYDQEGTEELLSFFGPIVFRFPLEEAIGRCLVEYDYYVHPVELTPDEMDQWHDLTAKIRRNAWRQKDGKVDHYLARLFRDRRALLETAENKISALDAAIHQAGPRTLQHTLIYASDKDPGQLQDVNNLLNSYGILFHQLTHHETSDRSETSRIIGSFQEGTLGVLTAKRVLDEGVNIPQVRRAFILASTTVERQWVQRRGRLLRKCEEIDKDHSEIHDFVAVPPGLPELDEEAGALVKSELLRVQEFARLARNAGRPDGPLEVIDRLVKAAYV